MRGLGNRSWDDSCLEVFALAFWHDADQIGILRGDELEDLIGQGSIRIPGVEGTFEDLRGSSFFQDQVFPGEVKGPVLDP